MANFSSLLTNLVSKKNFDQLWSKPIATAGDDDIISLTHALIMYYRAATGKQLGEMWVRYPIVALVHNYEFTRVKQSLSKWKFPFENEGLFMVCIDCTMKNSAKKRVWVFVANGSQVLPRKLDKRIKMGFVISNVRRSSVGILQGKTKFIAEGEPRRVFEAILKTAPGILGIRLVGILMREAPIGAQLRPYNTRVG